MRAQEKERKIIKIKKNRRHVLDGGEGCVSDGQQHPRGSLERRRRKADDTEDSTPSGIPSHPSAPAAAVEAEQGERRRERGAARKEWEGNEEGTGSRSRSRRRREEGLWRGEHS